MSKAYLLRPDLPEEGVERKPRPGEVPGQLSEHLQANADDAGLVNMKRPKRTPNSLKALQSVQYAKEHAKGIELRDALYSAYWEEGKDIGEMSVLRELVEGLDLEWAPLEAALAESAYLPKVLEEFQEGIDLGFEGIPAFVIGDVKFTGAQPMAIFRQLGKRAQAIIDGKDVSGGLLL